MDSSPLHDGSPPGFQAATAIEDATVFGEFGLYPAADFRITTGASGSASTVRQALWYFRDQIIAVPEAQCPIAGFATGVSAFDDLRQWLKERSDNAAIDYPPLVWVAAPQLIRHARLAAEGNSLATAAGDVRFRATPKIPLNRSYFDASSVAYFARHTITVRGESTDDTFVARTLWPEDFRLGPAVPPPHALADPSSPAASMRDLMREAPRGGVASPSSVGTLWQRDGVHRDWTGSAVLALMVNGAQGDDDEAHGGHFALVTGRVRSDGAIGNWLVNNYYSLDVESEKGILAAPVPLDNYLGDLNSGQAWYRPSYLLVAVLRDQRAAVLVQSALNRVYNQFYRHQLDYYHPSQNCTSISVDVLRALGWSIPGRSASNRVAAWLSFPYLVTREASLRKAKLAFDYLVSDRTRLLPAAALEEAFASLLSLLRRDPNGADEGPLARMLADDIDALVYLRLPQFPSSRAFGDAPAVSLHEYRARVPRDPALVQIVPVPSRPFPDSLRDSDLLRPPWRPSDYAALVWGLLVAVTIACLLWRFG